MCVSYMVFLTVWFVRLRGRAGRAVDSGIPMMR